MKTIFEVSELRVSECENLDRSIQVKVVDDEIVIPRNDAVGMARAILGIEPEAYVVQATQASLALIIAGLRTLSITSDDLAEKLGATFAKMQAESK